MSSGGESMRKPSLFGKRCAQQWDVCKVVLLYNILVYILFFLHNILDANLFLFTNTAKTNYKYSRL